MTLNKNNIEKEVRNIASITNARYAELKDIGVLAGRSGAALFQFHCAEYFDDDQFAKNGVEIISSCIELINNGYSYPTYCNGVAGLGWALEQLNEKEFIALDLDELLAPFDDFLKTQMELELSNGNYDFLHGALGYAFYFLKRFTNTKNAAYRISYRFYLETFVHGMNTLAIRNDKTITWTSILNHEKGNKGYNLSLSHGISSIVYILSKIYTQGIEKNLCSELIEGTIEYLLLQEDSTKNNNSLFPNWIDPNSTPTYNSRIAWCYGDIGIGKAFEFASKVLEKAPLKKKSLQTLLHASKRLAPETSLVVDAGFCHGSFGNAHIFQQLGLSCQEEQFVKTGKYWFNDGLNRRFSEEKEPYKRWNHVKENFRFELNLLEGISGIGLCMLDFLKDGESAWDECLMLR